MVCPGERKTRDFFIWMVFPDFWLAFGRIASDDERMLTIIVEETSDSVLLREYDFDIVTSVCFQEVSLMDTLPVRRSWTV